MLGLKSINSLLQDVRQLFRTNEVMVNILVCMVWANSLVSVLRAIVNRIPTLSDYIDETVAVCYIIPILLALPVLLRKFTFFDIFFYLFWPLLYLINYLIYPNNEQALIDTAFKSLCVAAPCFFIGRLLDIDRYFRIFIFLSAICILWDLFYYISYVQSMKNAKEMANILSNDNMSASYNILPYVMFLFWATMRRFNLLTLALGIIGLLLILSFGSRGPLACFGFFVLVYFFFFMKNKYSRYIKICIIFGVVLVIPFIVEFTMFIKYIFEKFSLSTRIVDRILSGGMTHDTGRSGIRDRLYGILDNSDNIFGFGIYGSVRYGVLYAHNLFCDVFFTFGYYVGTLLFILLGMTLVYAFILARKVERECLLFLLPLSIIKLLLSSTFISEPFFYMIIGYSVYIIHNNANCMIKTR